MNLTPLLLLIVLASILSYVHYKQKRTKISFWLFPLLFPEADEREKMITAQACRNSFISLWIMIPVSTILLSVYPMLLDSVSEFPVYLLLGVMFILITVFHTTLYKRISE